MSVASSVPHDESFLSVANSSMASAGSYTDFQVLVCGSSGSHFDLTFCTWNAVQLFNQVAGVRLLFLASCTHKQAKELTLYQLMDSP